MASMLKWMRCNPSKSEVHINPAFTLVEAGAKRMEQLVLKRNLWEWATLSWQCSWALPRVLTLDSGLLLHDTLQTAQVSCTLVQLQASLPWDCLMQYLWLQSRFPVQVLYLMPNRLIPVCFLKELYLRVSSWMLVNSESKQSLLTTLCCNHTTPILSVMADHFFFSF